MQIKKVIFGVGDYGKRTFEVLRKSDINKDEIAFCDNFVKYQKERSQGV